MARNKISKFSNEELEKILEKSLSLREVLQEIGYNTNGSGGYALIKRECQIREIVIPNYNYFGSSEGIQKRMDDKDVFCENSTYSRHHLKKRIINNNLIEYKCKKCENKGEWINEKLSLQLEHKNGVSNDNRLENLSFLCPNCHSQTETFASKSRKKK